MDVVLCFMSNFVSHIFEKCISCDARTILQHTPPQDEFSLEFDDAPGVNAYKLTWHKTEGDSTRYLPGGAQDWRLYKCDQAKGCYKAL